MNMHVATNTHTAPTLREWTKAYTANTSNRAQAHRLMAYVKRNPLTLCDATNFDIVALARASELVGE